MAASSGAGSRRHEVYYKFIVDLEAGKGGRSNLKAQEQAFKNKINSTVGGLGSGFEDVTAQWDKKLPAAAGRTGKKMYNAMVAPFASGFIQKGFGVNAEMDDYILKQTQLRGITTGLRHEVGKLRNTLLLFAFATAGVVTEFKNWFQAALKNEAALVGLRAVAISTGLSFQKLSSISQDLESKGFLSVSGSSSALKNLAASNLTMGETEKVLKALTDAAAFNRQGTLGMEEAIVGATQGIKNQNSIMIDNAGITKNVSVMYREYAAAVGKTSGSLTEQEKKQAIVNGIMREAALFSGNAEKSLTTYQGKITKFQTNLLKTQRGLGLLIAPGIVEGLESISDIFSEVGSNELFSKTVKSIADSFSTLVKSVGYFVQALERSFNFFNSFGGGLSMLLDSPIIKFGIMLTLLKKAGDYATGFADRLRAAAFAKTFQGIEDGMLRNSVISKMKLDVPLSTLKRAELSGKMIGTAISNKVSQVVSGTNMPLKNVPGEKLMKNAQNESIIQAAVLINMKNRTAESLVEEQVSKRLNSLSVQRNIIAQGGVLEEIRRNAILKNQAAQQAELNRIEQARSSIITRVTPDKSGANMMRAYKNNQQQLQIVADAQKNINALKKEHDILEMHGAGPEMTRQRDLIANKQAYIALLKEQYVLEQKASAAIVTRVWPTFKDKNRLKAPVMPLGEVQFSTRDQRAKDRVGSFDRRLRVEEEINRVIAQRERLEAMGVQKGAAMKTTSSERVLVEKEILQSKALQLEKELLINNARMMGYNILERTRDKVNKETGKVQEPKGTLTMVKDLSKEKGLKTGEQRILTDNKNRLMIASMNEVARANSGMLGKMIIDWKLVGQVIKTATLEGKLFFTNLKLGVAGSIFSVKTLGMAFQSLKTAIITTGAAFMAAFSTIMIWVTMAQVAWSLLGDLFKDNSGLIKEQIKLVDIETKALNDLYVKNKDVNATVVATSKTYHNQFKEFSDFSLLMSKRGNTSATLLNNMNKTITKLKVYENDIANYRKGLLLGKSPDEDWLAEQQKQIDDLKTTYSSYYTELTEMVDKYNESIEYTIDKLNEFSVKGGGSFGQVLSKSKDFMQGLREIEANRLNLLAINLPQEANSLMGFDEDKQFTAYHALKIAATQDYYRELAKIVDTKEKEIVDIRNKYIDLQLSNVSDSLEKQIQLAIDGLEKESNSIKEQIRKINSETTIAQSQFGMQKIQLMLSEAQMKQETTRASNLIQDFWSDATTEYYKAAKRFGDKIVNVPGGMMGSPTTSKIAFEYDLDVQAPIAKSKIDEVNAKIKEMKTLSGQIDVIIRPTVEAGELKLTTDNLNELDTKLKLLTKAKEELNLITLDKFEKGFEKEAKDVDELVKKTGNSYAGYIQNVNMLATQANNDLVYTEVGTAIQTAMDTLGGLNTKEIDSLNTLLSKTENSVGVKIQKLVTDFEDLTTEENNQAAAMSNLSRAYSNAAPNIIGLMDDYNALRLNIVNTRYTEAKAVTEFLTTMALEKKSMEGIAPLLDRINAAREKKIILQEREFFLTKYTEMVKETAAAQYELDMLNRSLDNVVNPEVLDFFQTMDKALSTITDKMTFFQNMPAIPLPGELKPIQDETVFNLPIVLNPTVVKIEDIDTSRNTFKEFVDANRPKFNNLKGPILIAFNNVLDNVIQERDTLNRKIALTMSSISPDPGSLDNVSGAFNSYGKQLEDTIKSSDFFKPALIAFQNKIAEFDQQLKTAQADKKDRESVTILGAVFNLDEAALNRIETNFQEYYDKAKVIIDKYKDMLWEEMEKLRKLGGPGLEGLNDTQKAALSELQSLFMQAGTAFENFKNITDDMSLVEKQKVWAESIKGTVGAMVELGVQVGLLIGNNKAASDEVYRNQEKSMQDIDKLYMNGEITQGERLYRMAEMNKYYASQISSTWQIITLSVTKSILDMTQQIISAMAQAAAAKAMGDSFFASLGSGLLSALPFVGAAVAVGALAAALATPEPEMEMPEFDTPQNQMSKFGGTIKAEDVVITIQPTFFIEGQQVFIGSGSVVEFVDEATELMKTGIQQAIDNKEFTFDSVRSLG